MKITQGFEVSLDGVTVTNFAAGVYDDLPQAALVYARNNNLLEEKEKPQPQNKARTSRSTKAK